MPYVGHRPILPIQDYNEWKHNVKDEVGVYSNYSLQSSIHLLQDVGDATLPDYPQYAQGRHLSQVFNGEFEYKPMELAKFSHGGQDAPYLRHAHWEYHGVEASEVFTASIPGTSATAELGTITTASNDYTVTNLSFDITVDGGAVQTVTSDALYGSRLVLVNYLNSQVQGATFTYLEDSPYTLTITSDSVGADSSLLIENTVDVATSGVENLALTEGTDPVSTWGYTVEEAKDRNFTFSRHSNFFFYGVPSADLTFSGKTIRYWGDEGVPSGFGRIRPYIYQGVGDDVMEDPGVLLADLYTAADAGNDVAHQRTKQWFGVAGAKAL